MRSPQSGPAGPAGTLADVLAAGPLSLAVGLRCAGEIATILRDLHQQTRAYGKLTAASVVMTETGPRLRPLLHYPDESAMEGDVQAFGALFYEMLAGATAPATLTAGDVRVHGPRTGAGRVRPAALKLAMRCQEPKGATLSMQRVATEIRLLGLLLRQHEANRRTGSGPARTATPPFVIKALPPPDLLVDPPAVAHPAAADFAQWMEPVEMEPVAGDAGVAPVVPLGRDSFGHPEAKTPAERQPAGGNCPKCDSASVYVSRPRSRFEQMLEGWSVPICRCHRCYHRYLVFARFKIAKEMPAGSRRNFASRDRDD